MFLLLLANPEERADEACDEDGRPLRPLRQSSSTYADSGILCSDCIFVSFFAERHAGEAADIVAKVSGSRIYGAAGEPIRVSPRRTVRRSSDRIIRLPRFSLTLIGLQRQAIAEPCGSVVALPGFVN